MCIEMKLRDILDFYADQISMLDSKARLDREKVMDNIDRYDSHELAVRILAVNMDYAQALDERRNKTIKAILDITKGE